MNKEIQKQEIIRLIRSIADASGGVPPGEKKFKTETGIGPHEWRYRIWRNWSDALAEAGFTGTGWVTRRDDDIILGQVLALAKKLGTFPNSTELQFEGANNSEFISYKALQRRWKMGELAAALRGFADARGETTVVAACDAFLAASAARPRPSVDQATDKAALGYVYLIKYGKDFKIGRTSSMARRSREVQFELPDETVRVHAILTDDPVGVEAYWHRRFAEKRGNGEWFKLSAADLAAFKRWTKIA